MRDLKFGIVTSFYNSEKYVDNVFKSILQQTYTNWVYFITDDGSTDGTKEKILKYVDNKKIFYVEQKFKKEMFWQPQRFVTEDCDYVITMDSDDRVLPKALEVYNNMLNKYEDQNIVFISTDSSWYIDDSDDLLNPTFIYNSRMFSLSTKNIDRDPKLILDKKSPNNFGSFRGMKNIKDLDFKVNDCNVAGNNDILHSCLLQKYGNTLLIKRNLYKYSYRNNSISHKPLSDKEWEDSSKIESIINSEEIKNDSKIVNNNFDNLYTDLNSFMLCDFNERKDKNLRINLITKYINKDFSHLKDLYSDHFLDINNFTDDFDYYVLNFSDYDFSDLSKLEKIIQHINSKKYKQLCIYYFDKRNSDEIRQNPFLFIDDLKQLINKYFGAFFWTSYYRHFLFSIDNGNYEIKDSSIDIINESASLGDTLAWIPIVNEFAKINKTKVNLYTPHKDLFKFQYPLINFYNYDESGQSKQKIKYNLGCFEGMNWKAYSLQEIACKILNVPYKETLPKLNIDKNKPKSFNKKYVCIATQSTAQCKYWNNPTGWYKIVDYLKFLGYEVVCIDKHKYYGIEGRMNCIPSNCIDKTGNLPLEDRINDLYHCDFFIGLGSGLSWLAWAIGKPVVMISGFSDPKSEFYTPYRVHNKNVCNSCWNDQSLSFDRSNWLWCPRNKDFECSKEITFEMVREKVNNCIENL